MSVNRTQIKVKHLVLQKVAIRVITILTSKEVTLTPVNIVKNTRCCNSVRRRIASFLKTNAAVSSKATRTR